MISFVILHYKNLHDTIECIKSINKLKTKKDISIIVVDNNSLNEKEKTKLKRYTKNIVLLKENVGYANGNNAGCEYAIKNYKPDFLCVINNDTIINQSNFIDEIYDCYDKTKFDVMGPKIITNDGDSVNPFYAYESLDEIDEKIKYSEKLIKIYKNVLLRNLLKIYITIKRLFKKPKKMINGSESKFNVALHGCALIFSKKYYKKYKDVFYKGTFLYHEEEFLNYRRKKDNLIFYYDSNLEIFHKEGSSLNESFKNSNYEKLIYRNQEIIKSLTKLKQIIMEDKKI